MLNTIRSYLSSFVNTVESIPVSTTHIIAAVLLVGVIRSLMELFGSATMLPATWQLPVVLQGIAFYTFSFFLFLLLLRLLLPKVQEHKLKSVMIFAIFTGLLPPIIDFILSATSYEYNYFTQFTWTLFASSQPVGESITLWITISAFGLYAWYKSQSFIRGLLAFVSAYLVFQFLGFIIGALGSWLFIVLAPVLGVPVDYYLDTGRVRGGAELMAMQGSMIMVLLGCLFCVLIAHRWEIFRMAFLRLPQALIWGSLVLLGAALASNGVNAYILIKAIIMTIFFVFIQIENDYYDKELDAITKRSSPVKLDDLYLIRFITALVVLLFLIFDSAFGLLLGLFTVLGFVYSHKDFRFKRHFIAGSMIVGVASFVALLIGIFDFSTIQVGPSIIYAALAAVFFGVFVNIRDYKDVDGDRQGGITTMYTWLENKGISPDKTHLILWSPVMLVSIASILYIIFGTASTSIMYVSASLLTLTMLLPITYIKKRRLSTTLAVLHVVLLLVASSLYVLPNIVEPPAIESNQHILTR